MRHDPHVTPGGTEGLIVSTERLGWPAPRAGWRRRLPWETQRRLVYEDRPEEPSATCHLQRQEREPALCGFHWERLIVVPGGRGWMDLESELRCKRCGEVLAVPSLGVAGAVFVFDSGDLQCFPDVRSAADYVEVYDIVSLRFYRADGVIVKAIAHGYRVHLEPTEERDEEGLKAELRKFLGHPRVGLDPSLADNPAEAAVVLMQQHPKRRWRKS